MNRSNSDRLEVAGVYEHDMRRKYTFLLRKVLSTAFLSASVLVWTAGHLSAAPRSEHEARLLADAFLKSQASPLKRFSASADGLTLVATSDGLGQGAKRSADAGVPAWYVYNQGAEAFVLVSGDDRMPDILGYSTDGAFVAKGMPANLRAWLENYTAWADALQAGRVAETASVQAVPANCPESVAPLLGGISYDQTPPYNNLCPELDGEHCATGCMATAMATIMSYWKYPECGTGSHSYTTETYGFPCSFDFANTTFDWETILPAYVEGEYTDEQAEAIATLMYACGVAVDMDYGPESGAYEYKLVTGMVEYFDFNPYVLLHNRVEYTTQEWMELVCSELSARRPIYYSGADKDNTGHAFILDGYDRNGMVHVNWGWSGLSDGYFNIVMLNPNDQGVGGGSGSGFAFRQKMATGLVPSAVGSVPKSLLGGMEGFCIEADSASVSKVENYGSTFSGNIAVIAERDGVQAPMSEFLQMEDWGTYYSVSFTGMSLSYPEEAGTYRVYLGSRADGEASWTKVRNDGFSPNEYVLTVREDGTHELVEVTRQLVLPEVGQLSCDSILYAGCWADISLPISNPLATDYLVGYVDFYIREGDGADRLFETQGLVLLPGEERTTTQTVSLPDVEGTCTFSAYWRTSNSSFSEPVGQGFTAEVRKGVMTDEVHLRSVRMDRDAYVQGDTATCTWLMDIDGLDADIFSQRLLLGAYMKGSGAYDWFKYLVINVEQGEPREFSHRFVVDEEPGTYYLQLMYDGSALFDVPFSVAEPSTVVAVDRTADNRPEWCPSDGGTELRFRYAKEVERVVVYDVAGRLVRTAKAVRDGHGVYAVDGSGLSRGQYVMRIPAADGSTAALKFVR